jgi:hypothetical protein
MGKGVTWGEESVNLRVQASDEATLSCSAADCFMVFATMDERLSTSWASQAFSRTNDDIDVEVEEEKEEGSEVRDATD